MQGGAARSRIGQEAVLEAGAHLLLQGGHQVAQVDPLMTKAQGLEQVRSLRQSQRAEAFHCGVVSGKPVKHKFE